MSLGRCDGCDKPLASEHIRTVDRAICAECLAEHRTQAPLVKPRIMTRFRARYLGTCPRCHQRIQPNTLVAYDPQTRKAFHASCADNLEAEQERQALPL